MLPKVSLGAATSLAAAIAVVHAEICSPNNCVPGSSISDLLVYDKGKNQYLIPGAYDVNSVSHTPPTVALNQSFKIGDQGVIIGDPLYPVTFPKANYKGHGTGQPAGSDPGEWQSAFFPPGWYGIVAPGQAVWGAIPDKNQLPGENHEFSVVGSDLCTPHCSHGNCGAVSNGTDTINICLCETGWGGDACDVCTELYFGPSCQECAAGCTHCDDGLLGSGACTGTTSQSSDCDCDHGTCTSSTSCECAAGWGSNTQVSMRLCNTCIRGFFMDNDGDCRACPLGCVACQLGGTGTPVCTACVDGYNITGTPATCTSGAKINCGTGDYWDGTTCVNCDSTCASCYGPGPGQCLECSAGYGNLGGACVGLDLTTGICDSSLSSLNGAYVMNNAINTKKCDSCPTGCLTCSIPNFTTDAAFAPSCNTCQEGFLLLPNSTCVSSCPSGFYISSEPGINGTCAQCDGTCATCAFTSTHCTQCVSGYALNGQCINSCPTNTIADNNVCSACHPDCASCSLAGSADHCLSCPNSRPVLINGTCDLYCPYGSYFNGDACQPCNSSCAGCIDATSCVNCADGLILQSGKCMAATSCGNTFALGLGVCLVSLVDKSTSNLAYLALLSLLLAFVILAAFWYIRRERARTRAATREFAQRLDEQAVHRRLDTFPVTFFDRVFGHRDAHEGGREFARDARAKNRLRDLVLPTTARTRAGIPAHERKHSHGQTAAFAARDRELELERPRAEGSAPARPTLTPSRRSSRSFHSTAGDIPMSPIRRQQTGPLAAAGAAAGGTGPENPFSISDSPLSVSPASSRSASPSALGLGGPHSHSPGTYPPSPPRPAQLHTGQGVPRETYEGAREVRRGGSVVGHTRAFGGSGSSAAGGEGGLHDLWPSLRENPKPPSY